MPQAELPEAPVLDLLAGSVPGVLTRLLDAPRTGFDFVDLHRLKVLSGQLEGVSRAVSRADAAGLLRDLLDGLDAVIKAPPGTVRPLGGGHLLVTLHRLLFEVRLALLGSSALDGTTALDLVAVELTAFANSVRRNNLCGTDEVLHLLAVRAPQDATWAWLLRTIRTATRLRAQVGLQ